MREMLSVVEALLERAPRVHSVLRQRPVEAVRLSAWALRRAKPVFYGLIVGYVFAVGCCFVVDLIWFPGGDVRHYVHGY